jgi:hypothetical protein
MARPGLLVAILAALAASAPQSAAHKPIEGCFGFGTFNFDKTKNVVCKFQNFEEETISQICISNYNDFLIQLDDLVMKPIKYGEGYYIVTDNQDGVGATFLAFELDQCEDLKTDVEIVELQGIGVSFSDDPNNLKPKPPKEAVQLLLDFIKNDGVVLSPKIEGLAPDNGSPLRPLEIFFIVVGSAGGLQLLAMISTRKEPGWTYLKNPLWYWKKLYKKYF